MTFVSLIYLILALLGLSFLIFIHELGHYFMARRCGMRVETFSIGFGGAIFKWKIDGVTWQIGWLPFGGYVKIAGMDAANEKDPYAIKDGFFGKSPVDRIKVALMGPLVNIVFAFFAFTLLFALGGREKNFNEYTHKIGWVDPKSQLYADGVRPGDEIISYNGQPFTSAKDHLAAPMFSNGEIAIQGAHVSPITKEKTAFHYNVKTYPHPSAVDSDVVTSGILGSANYIIYKDEVSGKKNPLPEGSPLANSGIENGDRIVWADGVNIYSLQELSHVLDEAKALITLQRGQDVLLRRVPRIFLEELKLDPEMKEELVDWQFEAHLKGTKFTKLAFIPYNLNDHGVVEGEAKFIDKEKREEAFPEHLFSPIDAPLKEGDQILAVDGRPMTYSFEILAALQQHLVNVVVQRGVATSPVSSWSSSDALFDQQYKWEDLQRLVSQIGLAHPPQSAHNLVLLKAVLPKSRKDFATTPESQRELQEEIDEQLQQAGQIEDSEKRAHVIRHIKEQEKQLLLGLPAVQDLTVQYNPGPITLFVQVYEEIWHTLKALLTGSLNPKWMSGPVGIVQVFHDRSMMSLKEAVFWLGAISLNLGVLNLLPFPVLDGGTICFALYEKVTGKKLKAKTMEKLIIPFAILLIGLFIFLTYHDISRLFSGWMR